MEEQLKEFEKLKKNELKATSDVKKIKAAYSEIEQEIIESMQRNGSNTLWHHNQEKNQYYKFSLPEKAPETKKRMPPRDDYLKWLSANWSQKSRELANASPARFYEMFVEEAMNLPPKKPRKTDGPKLHLLLKSLTEEDFIKQKTQSELKKIKERQEKKDVAPPTPSKAPQPAVTMTRREESSSSEYSGSEEQ